VPAAYSIRVNVFRVFAKITMFTFLRMLNGRRDTFEVLHRPQTNEKIEKLPECDIERTNAPATGVVSGP